MHVPLNEKKIKNHLYHLELPKVLLVPYVYEEMTSYTWPYCIYLIVAKMGRFQVDLAG